MTDDELDRARAERALELYRKAGNYLKTVGSIGTQTVATISARLAREGWKPEDPLLKEARTIAAAECSDPVGITKTHAGDFDTHYPVRIALAALRRGMELAQK